MKVKYIRNIRISLTLCHLFDLSLYYLHWPHSNENRIPIDIMENVMEVVGKLVIAFRCRQSDLILSTDKHNVLFVCLFVFIFNMMCTNKDHKRSALKVVKHLFYLFAFYSFLEVDGDWLRSVFVSFYVCTINHLIS